MSEPLTAEEIAALHDPDLWYEAFVVVTGHEAETPEGRAGIYWQWREALPRPAAGRGGRVSDENALRLDWADFEPTSDRDAMALALLVAGIVIDTDDDGRELPGDLVRPALAIADRVIEALASSGRILATLDAAPVETFLPGGGETADYWRGYHAALAARDRPGLDVERLGQAFIAAGIVWVIPAKEFRTAVEVVAAEYDRLAEAQQREGAGE